MSRRSGRRCWRGTFPLGPSIRQLPRLTRIGVIKPLGGAAKDIAARLTDEEALKKARIHPLNVLIALNTYASGRGIRGSSSWNPNSKIIDALDAAFYRSFVNVEPAGKRTLIAMDVSGSMSFGQVAGVPLTPREATTGLALVLAATEPETHIIGFTGGSRGQVYLGPNDRAKAAGKGEYASSVSGTDDQPEDAARRSDQGLGGLPFGPTDCALPMLYAKERGLEVDTFIVTTDNETWVGDIHPHEALEQYRRPRGSTRELIVLATSATRFSIADPDDAGMLDIAGFDAAVPAAGRGVLARVLAHGSEGAGG